MATNRQYRDFVALADAGSFTRAAAELHVAQPALTYQIKRLETELGLQLFVRGPRGVTPTAEGEALLPLARSALRAFEAIGARAAELRGGDPAVAFSPLFEEEVVAGMASDHPLAARERISIEELIQHPLYADLHPRGRWTDWWDAVEHRGGQPVRYAGRFVHHDEWLEALRMGALLPTAGTHVRARRRHGPGRARCPVARRHARRRGARLRGGRAATGGGASPPPGWAG